jgi:hypothetical protein
MQDNSDKEPSVDEGQGEYTRIQNENSAGARFSAPVQTGARPVTCLFPGGKADGEWR